MSLFTETACLACTPMLILLYFTKEKGMKSMTCKQVGGACDKLFQADSFEAIAEMSQAHGMEMFQKQDAEHLEAMEAMKGLMAEPEKMQNWFEAKRKEFEALPEDEQSS